MLVLSRQEDESVCIGDDIKVTIVSITGKKVRLGFEAPDDIEIHRQEIYEQTKKRNNSRTM